MTNKDRHDKAADDFWARNNATENPLFMQELPDDPASNPHLAGLMALSEEALRSAQDAITHWKQVGNDHFAEATTKQKPQRLRDAIDAYKKGLETPETEGQKEFQQIRAQLFGNIALCHFKLRQYADCVDWARKAIATDASYVKGYLFAARGCFCNELYNKCIEFCRACPEASLAIDEVREQAERKQREKDARKADAAEEDASRTQAVIDLMKSRGITYSRKPEYDVACDLPKIESSGNVFWPVLLLVDEYNVAESAPEVDETATMGTILSAMFATPAPWDRKGDFVVPHLEIWAGDVKLADESRLIDAITTLKQIKGYPVLTVKRKAS